MAIPTVLSAKSRVGVVARRKDGTPAQVRQARCDLNAAMILSLIRERTETGGIANEHLAELKAALDDAVSLL